MNEIQTLLQQYKWVIDKLELVNKKYNELQEFDKIKEELRKVKRNLEQQIKDNQVLRNNISLLMTILKTVNNIEICKQCNWHWWWEDWEWWWWMCDICWWTWYLEKKTL